MSVVDGGIEIVVTVVAGASAIEAAQARLNVPAAFSASLLAELQREGFAVSAADLAIVKCVEGMSALLTGNAWRVTAIGLHGRQACINVTKCTSDEWESAKPTASSDRDCSTRSATARRGSTLLKEPTGSRTACAASATRRVSSSTPGTNLTDRACGDCSKGWYQEKPNQAACTACAAGKRGTGTGMPDEVGACTACDPGRFQGLSGQDTCKQCPAGMYQNKFGVAMCKACATGEYQADVGKDDYDKCRPGRFQDAEGSAAIARRVLWASTRMSGTSSCDDCAVGRYQNSTGATTCVDCPRTAYGKDSAVKDSLGAECSECPAGRSSRESAVDYMALVEAAPLAEDAKMPSCGASCMALCFGEHGLDGALTCRASCGEMCDMAESGSAEWITFRHFGKEGWEGLASADSILDFHHTCHVCDAGQYQDAPGQDKCVPCGRGKYRDAAKRPWLSEPDACTSCEPHVGNGTFQESEGKSSCEPKTTCPPGTGERWNGGAVHDRKCAPCAAGRTFSPLNDGQPCANVTQCTSDEWESVADGISTVTARRAARRARRGSTPQGADGVLGPRVPRLDDVRGGPFVSTPGTNDGPRMRRLQ